MKTKFKKILLILLVLILGYMIFSKDVSGIVISTQSILRQTPPSPPTPPDKPEPPCPPPCVTPTPTPPPEPTPTPPPGVTPTPSLTPPPELTPTPPPIGGPGEATVCGATVPPAPTLLSVNRVTDEQASLSWSAVTPVSHYSISYGLFSGNYIYGVSNTGNVTSFTVGGLQVGADYCFAVRTVNDCMPGTLSNEICTGKALAGGAVLGASTLGATGSFADELLQVLFIISSACLSLGLRLYLPVKRLV